MIVNGKLVTYDLSRFRKCKLKSAAICDLMQIPEFVTALENEKEFDVSDAWITKIASELVVSLRIKPDEKPTLSEEMVKTRRRWQHIATNVVKRERKLGVVDEREACVENEI